MNARLFIWFVFVSVVSGADKPILDMGFISSTGRKPVALPSMIPSIVNPAANPFVVGPLDSLFSSKIYNPGLLLPSPLLPFGRRLLVGKRGISIKGI